MILLQGPTGLRFRMSEVCSSVLMINTRLPYRDTSLISPQGYLAHKKTPTHHAAAAQAYLAFKKTHPPRTLGIASPQDPTADLCLAYPIVGLCLREGQCRIQLLATRLRYRGAGVTRNSGHAPPLGWSYAPRHRPTVGP